MSLEIFPDQQHLQKTSAFYNAELVNKYTKCIKTIGKRIIEVEFHWFQAKPCQNFRLRMTEQQFMEARKYISSKKLFNISFEQFTDLIAPVFANDAAEISDCILRSTFDRLFDQNSNGTIEQDEFESLLTLLRAFNTNENNFEKRNFLYNNLRQTFVKQSHHISYEEFSKFVKNGYVRELLMG